jgi:hypothetical protein
MGSGRLSLFPLVGAAFVMALLASAHADEPSARDLIELASVLDSADVGCWSLDVSGYIGSEKDATEPRLRFRALYRAPDRFSLLITDAADGTPLALCSGKKMLVYDPIGPTVYYSEAGGFILAATNTDNTFKFKCDYYFKYKKDDQILINLRSITSPERRDAEGWAFEDRVFKRNACEFKLIRSHVEGLHEAQLAVNVDLTKACPYTAVGLAYDGDVVFRFDRLVLNEELRAEAFAFPTKEQLSRGLPINDVTMDDGLLATLQTSMIVARASLARAFVNSARPPGPIDLPRLVGVDWNRVKENDRKYSKTLREILPPILRAKTATPRRDGSAAPPSIPTTGSTTQAASTRQARHQRQPTVTIGHPKDAD